MDLKLYIGYENYDDKKFEGNERDFLMGLHTDMIEYYMYNDDINKKLSSIKDGKTAYFNDLSNKDVSIDELEPENLSYSSCECVIKDANGEDETLDNLLEHFNKGDSFTEVIYFNPNEMEDIFEEDLMVWVNTNKRLMKDGEINRSLPKTFSFSLKNKKGIEIFGVLKDCKILENIDRYSYTLLVGKIIFTKSL